MEETLKLIETTFMSRPEELKHIRQVVRETVEKQGASKETIDCVVLAVNEACMNIIQHAYKSAPDCKIILEILLVGGEFVFRLIDFAEPVDKCKIKSRSLDELRPGGLGVHMMHKVMDEVVFLEPCRGAGNILELRKKIH